MHHGKWREVWHPIGNVQNVCVPAKQSSFSQLLALGEVECTDEEFMAMFEQMPEFDNLDDEFVANEEEWTSDIAHFIDNNIEKFASIDGKEG